MNCAGAVELGRVSLQLTGGVFLARRLLGRRGALSIRRRFRAAIPAVSNLLPSQPIWSI